MSGRREGPGGSAPPPGRGAPPPDDAGRDEFSRAREETAAWKDALERVRGDVESMVRREVSRSGMTRAQLEELVASAVRRELRARRPAEPAWRLPALAGAAVVVGLVLGALGYRWLGGPAATAGDATAAVAAESVEGPAPEEPDVPGGAAARTPRTDSPDAPPSSPAERAAVYDSLWAARSPRFDPLLAELEAAGPAAPVTGALTAWRGDGELTPGATRRLHDALVQLSLNRLAGAGLSLDGLVSRDPCRGNSCGALLEVWRTTADSLALPPWPGGSVAADTETLGVVERLVVLDQMPETGP